MIATMRPTVTRARLKLMLTLGVTPAEIMRIDEQQHIDWIMARRKAKGSNPRIRPFGERAGARAALREFASFDIWGKYFKSEGLRNAVVSAAKRAGIRHHVRAYDLRHTCATDLYKETGDIHAVQQWLGHQNEATTRRYIVGAVSARLVTAARAVNAADVKRHARQDERAA
jgi:integrase